jgi:O-antigen/teichoic acid export membrane protein
MARKENSIKNLVTSVVPYFLITLLGFTRVNAYINGLGEDVYALNQVFLQIFSYISIAEAGAGTLVTQLYYKALADKDKKEINIIFTSCKHIFRIISLIIFGIGIVVSFFLNIFTNNDLPLLYMQAAFILFLFRSVLEYGMLSPRFVIQADQKLYKVNLLIQGYRIVEMIVEITLLYMGVNYITLLIVTIIIRFISYLVTNKRIHKEYPWLQTVSKDKVIPIKGMHNVFYHKIVGAVYYNTDIILLSSFLSTTVVTIYSSYNYIVKTLTDIIQMCATAATPSFGNAMVTESEERRLAIFEEINSVFILAAGILSIILYKVMTPFVSIWIGNGMIMSQMALILMIVSLYLNILLRPFHMVKEVENLYKETQNSVLAEAVINIVLSVVFVKKFGITGVLLATVIARASTTIIFFPIYIYKNIFNKLSSEYYFILIINLVITILISYVCDKIFVIHATNYIRWFMDSIIYGIVCSILILVINMIYSKSLRQIIFKLFYGVRKKIKHSKLTK